VLVDGAQAVAHMPVDVRELDCDFYAFSSHKLYGPTGIGVLYGRRALLEAMPPYQGGGDMIRSVTFEKTTYNDLPYKFEAGTPDISAQIGMGAAAEYLMKIGMDAVRDHEHELARYAMETLPREVPGIEIYGPAADQRGGIVAFNLPGIHPHDVAQILDRAGICVRAGHHCTMPLHEHFDLAASARASFDIYSVPEEIDALAVGLREVVRVFDREPGSPG
jgi:cysteine desulfurase/selenocysteine lyase